MSEQNKRWKWCSTLSKHLIAYSILQLYQSSREHFASQRLVDRRRDLCWLPLSRSTASYANPIHDSRLEITGQ